MPRAELELLAPARDADIGIEAVNHGADAVYIGGPAFGAREKAGNSLADIERLVRHAHRFGARIFVTQNTILRDDELAAARQLAWSLWNIGVDALIVQDMGLLMLDLPPIQLHASTQTDIRTPEKARFLQDAGFSQMVLARELTLAEIRAIEAQVPQAVLEFFVHGALCVAYSGQCYISHAHTGRSANRGSCSQECRLPYTVTDAQGRVVAHDKHVLSLKDNDQSANLHALVDAGIRSFKIEGRYKDMATVKNVTAHYRQLCDRLLEERAGGPAPTRPGSSGRCRYTFAPDPERAYNRGGTDYFVGGRKDDIGAFDTPKHAGIAIGQQSALSAGDIAGARALYPATPTVTSLEATFPFTVRNTNGAADTARVYFQVYTSSAVPANSCHGFYDRPSNQFYLYNDALTTLIGPTGTLQNSQCRINASTVTSSGTGTIVLDNTVKGANFSSDQARAEAIRKAREAALADPEGRALESSLATHGITPLPPKAKTIQFMKRPAAPSKAA